jgi:hypothetical protein
MNDYECPEPSFYQFAPPGGLLWFVFPRIILNSAWAICKGIKKGICRYGGLKISTAARTKNTVLELFNLPAEVF